MRHVLGHRHSGDLLPLPSVEMLHDHIPLIITLSFAAFGVLTALVFLGLAIASVALREAEAMASCEPPPESDVYSVSDKQRD